MYGNAAKFEKAYKTLKNIKIVEDSAESFGTNINLDILKTGTQDLSAILVAFLFNGNKNNHYW